MGERVYYHFNDLEEYHDGLWKIVRGPEREINVRNASELMKDTGSFREAMFSALTKWPKSCEYNLTADGVNKLAWLGHAGCCIAVGSPEENTRCAWHTLNLSEQNDADRAAESVLWEWERCRLESDVLPLFEAMGYA